jgi:hypothetical protein
MPSDDALVSDLDATDAAPAMIEPINELVSLTATAAAQLIRESKLSALELTRACLRHIELRDPKVQAWAFLDPEHALRQARAADEWRKRGRRTALKPTVFDATLRRVQLLRAAK